MLYVVLVPTKRRLNDINLSAWWALVIFVSIIIPIINISFWLYLIFAQGTFAQGTSGINDYGLPDVPPSQVLTILAFIAPFITVVLLSLLPRFVGLPFY